MNLAAEIKGVWTIDVWGLTKARFSCAIGAGENVVYKSAKAI